MVQALSDTRAKNKRTPSGASPRFSLSDKKKKSLNTTSDDNSAITVNNPQKKTDSWEMTAEEALRVNFVECEI